MVSNTEEFELTSLLDETVNHPTEDTVTQFGIKMEEVSEISENDKKLLEEFISIFGRQKVLDLIGGYTISLFDYLFREGMNIDEAYLLAWNEDDIGEYIRSKFNVSALDLKIFRAMTKRPTTQSVV